MLGFDREYFCNDRTELSDNSSTLARYRRRIKEGRRASSRGLGSAVATNTRATEVRASLGTVQSLLGHSSSEVTRDVYLHSVPADAQGAVQRVGNLIGPKWTQVPETPELATTVIQ
jgi:integrase